MMQLNPGQPSHLIKELLPCCIGLNGKFQLSIHGGHSHTNLELEGKIN